MLKRKQKQKKLNFSSALLETMALITLMEKTSEFNINWLEERVGILREKLISVIPPCFSL